MANYPKDLDRQSIYLEDNPAPRSLDEAYPMDRKVHLIINLILRESLLNRWPRTSAEIEIMREAREAVHEAIKSRKHSSDVKHHSGDIATGSVRTIDHDECLYHPDQHELEFPSDRD